MNPISIVKAPKEGSKTDIDMQYLQETIAPFFRNDPIQYCTLPSPSRNLPDVAPEPSWLPQRSDEAPTIKMDKIDPEYFIPFNKVPYLDKEQDPENYSV